MGIAEGGVVLVPVPVQFLPPVYRLLAELMTDPPIDGDEHGPSDFGSRAPVAAELPDIEWSVEDLRRLRLLLLQRQLAAPLAVLDLTFGNVSSQYSFDEITNASGLAWGKARQQLAHLTWIVRDEFGRRNWPISVRFNSAGRARYSSDDADLAAAWRDISSKPDQPD